MIRERTAKMSLGPLFWTPTIQGLLNYEYVRDNPEQLDDPSWQVGLPKSIVDDIKAAETRGDGLEALKLKAVLRHFIEQHRPAPVAAACGCC